MEHFSDVNVLPAGYRIIEIRLTREFEHIEKVVEHRCHILRCVDSAGKIVEVYMLRDKQGLRMPTIKGYPATTGLLAKLITDKYQFHLSVERQVARHICMSHVCRKFVEVAFVDERSQCFVNLIGKLYWIESMIKLKHLSAKEIRKERKEKATSILIELKNRLQQIVDDPLTVYSESHRKAVTYAPTFWKQTTLYIEHGDWNINNTGERSMRPSAIGRKNFVGLGFHQGASLGACAYALVEICKLNTISAYEYIKKMLTLIGDEKEDANDYFALLPSVLAVK